MKTHQCPRCGTATRRVAATFGRNLVPLDLVPVHPLGSKQNFWTGGFPIAGGIAPEICPECDLVSWFAYPAGTDLPDPTQDEVADLPVVSADEVPAE